MIDQYVLATNDDGDLAVRTVQATESSSVTDTTSVITATDDGKLAVRVVGGGGGDSHNKGYYATQSALETAYPTAEAGDYAIVGSTDTVWIWDTDTSAWVDTDTKGEVTSVNGQTGTVVLDAEDVNAVPQLSTMPVASASNANSIVQYKGTTTGTYTNGYFYKNISDSVVVPESATVIDTYVQAPGSTITVEIIDMEAFVNAFCLQDNVPTACSIKFIYSPQHHSDEMMYENLTTGVSGSAENLPGDIAYWDFMSILWDGEMSSNDYVTLQYTPESSTVTYSWAQTNVQPEAIQVSSMPTASESNLGNIVQYIGATTEDYTNGYFYKCAANDSGVGSGEIDITYWYPDPFTPPVTGSVDIDVLSQYLEQNGLQPITHGRIEIVFQPNDNNIIFGYNFDTGGVSTNIPWNTVTTQAAEDIFANMGFDFDFSGVPTNMETATGGQMPSATVYFWKSQPVMDSIGVYKDSSELPEATEENVGTAYLVTPYDSETLSAYSPEMYMSVPYILNYIDGEAEVTYYYLTPETQPTDVMIDWATLESFLNSQETGFDWTNDSINISLNGENLDVLYNADFSDSAVIQTDGTVASIQQALENIGITVDLTGYTQFHYFVLKLPTEIGYENRQIPAFVPTSGTAETDYVLKADGNGGAYWAAESGGGGLPDQTGHSGEFLTTDGTDASWAAVTKVNTTVTIAVADWNGGTTVTKTVSGITATGVVLVSPDPTDQSAYTSAGIICTAQAADSLTFTCSTTPSADIDVNVIML